MWCEPHPRAAIRQPRGQGAAGTPREIVARLNGEIAKILERLEIRTGHARIGTDVVATDPEKFGALIRSEIAKWAEGVKEAGVQIN